MYVLWFAGTRWSFVLKSYKRLIGISEAYQGSETEAETLLNWVNKMNTKPANKKQSIEMNFFLHNIVPTIYKDVTF